jgi:hypothetical protein
MTRVILMDLLYRVGDVSQCSQLLYNKSFDFASGKDDRYPVIEINAAETFRPWMDSIFIDWRQCHVAASNGI